MTELLNRSQASTLCDMDDCTSEGFAFPDDWKNAASGPDFIFNIWYMNGRVWDCLLGKVPGYPGSGAMEEKKKRSVMKLAAKTGSQEYQGLLATNLKDSGAFVKHSGQSLSQRLVSHNSCKAD
jgi:hypothetical protein